MKAVLDWTLFLLLLLGMALLLLALLAVVSARARAVWWMLWEARRARRRPDKTNREYPL